MGVAVSRKVVRCGRCAEAEAASSPTAAVARLEAGTGAVVESLRDAAEPEAAHAVLQCAFSTLIRARAIGWRHAELTSGEDDGGGLFAPGSVELAAATRPPVRQTYAPSWLVRLFTLFMQLARSATAHETHTHCQHNAGSQRPLCRAGRWWCTVGPA